MNLTHGANACFLVQPPQLVFPVRHNPRGEVIWDFQPPIPRKPPQPSGIVAPVEDYALARRTRELLESDINELKKLYIFPPDDSVTAFLIRHPSIRTVLHEAVHHLKEYFGAERIFSIELSREEDGPQTLYAVAVWHNGVRSAAEALAAFEENWWLDHMTPATAELAFTYEIA